MPPLVAQSVIDGRIRHDISATTSFATSLRNATGNRITWDPNNHRLPCFCMITCARLVGVEHEHYHTVCSQVRSPSDSCRCRASKVLAPAGILRQYGAAKTKTRVEESCEAEADEREY